MLWVPDFWMHLYQVSPCANFKNVTSLRFLELQLPTWDHDWSSMARPTLACTCCLNTCDADRMFNPRCWKRFVEVKSSLTRGYWLQFLSCCCGASYSRVILLGEMLRWCMMVWLALGSGDAVIPWSVGVSLILPLIFFAVIRLSNLKMDKVESTKWWRVIAYH